MDMRHSAASEQKETGQRLLTIHRHTSISTCANTRKHWVEHWA